jgi:hypothetical protein
MSSKFSIWKILTLLYKSSLVYLCLLFHKGAVKLSSKCDIEREAAVYLFVKACVAVFFWGAHTVWIYRRNTEDILNNPFIEAYIILDLLFSLCWLFVGT